ncbi:MAG TPA: ATP-binding protein [Nitrospiria bacterium]
MQINRLLKSFKTKITLSILGVGLVAVMITLSVAYRVARTHLEQTQGANYQQLADSTSRKLVFLIEHQLREIELIALASDIRTGIRQANAVYSNRRMTETDIRNRIESLRTIWRNSGRNSAFLHGFTTNPASSFLKDSLQQGKNTSDHLSMLVTDQRGILVGSDVMPRMIYFGDEDWWRSAFNNGRGSVFVSDVYVRQESGEDTDKKYVLTLAIPIMDKEGRRAIGVLKTDMRIQQFFEAVTRVHIGRADHTMLASADGTLIFCPIFMIRNHTLLQELMRAIFKPDPGWTFTTADVHFAPRRAVNGFAPVVFDAKTIDIHPSSFGGKQWYIFTSQDPRLTYAPINTLLTWIIGACVMGAGLLSVLGLKAAEYIVQPLRELQRGAKLIGYGNLEHRLKIETGDELQELADEFNEMAIKLQVSYAGLEQKVAERTQELAVVNQITKVISSSLDLPRIFEAFCEEVTKLIEFDRISLSLMDESRQQIRIRLIKTKDSPIVRRDTPRPKAGSVIGWVLDNRQAFIRTDARVQSEFIEDRLILREGLRAYISIPIISQQTAIGTLNLVSRKPSAFSEANLDLLEPIAEQLAIAIETIRLFEQTKKLDLLKSEFVSKVSHELRTPLTSIKGFTEILLSYKDVDDKTRRDFITIIHEESERLTRLINDVLDLSKIEAGKVEWRIQGLRPGEVARNAINSIRPIAIEKNLSVVSEVPETLPLIRGDMDHLIQVLDNLLSNAIKFTPHGSVTIRARADGSMARFSVVDTGIGISAADTEKIFDKFFQLGDTRSGKPRGTGLGLAICREIIQYLGGQIWCESQRGLGSTFHFTLPFWPIDGRPLTSDSPQQPGEAPQARLSSLPQEAS